MAVDFDVTSLHHRRAAHRWERTSVAHGLLARGLSRGDVVMLFCENSVEGYLWSRSPPPRPGWSARRSTR